ncbi:response regulator [candidate division KSB1 bacterium]
MKTDLYNKEHQYRLLSENIQDLIYRYRLIPYPCFEYISPSIESFIGYTQEECYADPKIIKKIVHPDDHQLIESLGRNNLKSIDTTVRLIHKNGDVIWTEQKNKLLSNRKGAITAIEGIARNITDRKILEEELTQAQRLESVGRLTCGVLHDFNNRLSSIMGWAELLKINNSDILPKDKKAIDAIIENTKMAVNLSKKLLGFVRKRKYNPVLININKVLKETMKIDENIFAKNIELEYNLENKINLIKADEGQIQQVITNLIINANDAIAGEGIINLSTENVTINSKPKYINKLKVKSGKYIKLSITDDGIGMSDETKSKIFNPFFTTKELGKGTGLGLATTQEIVKELKGYIDCRSEVGKGTTFSIYFPVSSEYKSINIKKEKKNIKGTGTILIVDDNRDIRKVLKMQLELLGYKSLQASNGYEAMKVFEDNRNRIDLVLLDLIMPLMDGMETFRHLKKIKSDINVLILTGDIQDEKVEKMLNEGAKGFIKKPFQLSNLSNIINKTIQNEAVELQRESNSIL